MDQDILDCVSRFKKCSLTYCRYLALAQIYNKETVGTKELSHVIDTHLTVQIREGTKYLSGHLRSLRGCLKKVQTNDGFL